MAFRDSSLGFMDVALKFFGWIMANSLLKTSPLHRVAQSHGKLFKLPFGTLAF